MIRKFIRTTETTVELQIGEETVVTTMEHPFWVEGNGWVPSGALKVGDALRTLDGKVQHVTEVRKKQGKTTVYNFEVSRIHTYFVGKSGCLVHNVPCTGSGETLSRRGTDRESVRRLTIKAAEAEEGIGIHGVSVTAGEPIGPASQAAREAVEAEFPVHNTKSTRDPLHRTVELPKPVTADVARTFNKVFGRK